MADLIVFFLGIADSFRFLGSWLYAAPKHQKDKNKNFLTLATHRSLGS
jgi:hypothetical protein